MGMQAEKRSAVLRRMMSRCWASPHAQVAVALDLEQLALDHAQGHVREQAQDRAGCPGDRAIDIDFV